MDREAKQHHYTFEVVREEDGRYWIALRNLSGSRIVCDARVNYPGKTLTLELDLQTGEMTLRSVT